jgi:hypothetical protein
MSQRHYAKSTLRQLLAEDGRAVISGAQPPAPCELSGHIPSLHPAVREKVKRSQALTDALYFHIN